MPIYEYQCKNCEHIFEEMLPMKDMEIPMNNPCPNCQETGKIERYFNPKSTTRACFSYMGSTIQNKPSLSGSPIKERLAQIKKNFGGKQGFCRGIE